MPAEIVVPVKIAVEPIVAVPNVADVAEPGTKRSNFLFKPLLQQFYPQQKSLPTPSPLVTNA